MIQPVKYFSFSGAYLFLKRLKEEALVKALSTVTLASGIYFLKNL